MEEFRTKVAYDFMGVWVVRLHRPFLLWGYFRVKESGRPLFPYDSGEVITPYIVNFFRS